MDNKEIVLSNYIFNKLREEKHYLNEKCTYRYYNDFWKMMLCLSENDIFLSKKNMSLVANKLRITGNFDMNQYLQGVAEILLWYYFQRKGYPYKIDVKLNSNKNSDVDLQVMYDGIPINIEVKCPEIHIDNNENILNINTAFRTIDKESLLNNLEIIEDDIINVIIDGSNGKYENFHYDKINDTKVLTFLSSCANKFNSEKQEGLNVLFIALPSNEINNYWGYLYNAYSGIFTDNFLGKYKKNDGNYYSEEDIETTDVVIISNAVDGHIRMLEEFDSWKIENDFNLLCMNIHSKKFKNDDSDIRFKILYDLFSNDNLRFEKEFVDMEKEIKASQLFDFHPDVLFMDEYLSKYYNRV